jgi:hypothetical protein
VAVETEFVASVQRKVNLSDQTDELRELEPVVSLGAV